MNEIQQLYPHILRSLKSMSGSLWDSKTIADATGLARYMESSVFAATFVIAVHMLGYTYHLSKKLQGKVFSNDSQKFCYIY